MGSTGAGTARGGGGRVSSIGSGRPNRRSSNPAERLAAGAGGRYRVSISASQSRTGRASETYYRTEREARAEQERLRAAGQRSRVSRRRGR